MAEAGGVLVVGADGMIGAAVAARLEATGHDVIRTSRRSSPDTLPLDLAAEEIRIAANELGKITGRIDVEELLDVIFRDFCIGK